VLIRITVWQGLFSGFVTVWEIWKVVSTDCCAQRCSARHALAGIAIATMTSLRHRPTTDRGTDIATLVRRALAAVCTVPMLLVFLNGLLSQLIGFATVSADSGRSLKQKMSSTTTDMRPQIRTDTRISARIVNGPGPFTVQRTRA